MMVRSASFVSSLLLVTGFVLFLAPPGQGQDQEKKTPWVVEMLAARNAYRAERADADLTLTPWWATAPLPAKTLATPLFPEQGIDLQARDDKGKRSWRSRPKWVDGKVWKLPQKPAAATYLFRRIKVPKALTLTASFGSDDGIKVWLNGKVLLDKDVARGAAPDQDRVVLPLQAGVNRLLLKIYNGAGGHGFYFSLDQGVLWGIWQKLSRTYPRECAWFKGDLPGGAHLDWFRRPLDREPYLGLALRVLKASVGESGYLLERASECAGIVAKGGAYQGLNIYYRVCLARQGLIDLASLDYKALSRAVEHLTKKYPQTYRGREYGEQIGRDRKAKANLTGLLKACSAPEKLLGTIDILKKRYRMILLANPLLADLKLLLIKRKVTHPNLGLPQNWQGNCSLPRKGYDDELVLFSPGAPKASGLTTLYKPAKPSFIGDVDLHWDGDRLLFSAIGSHRRWQIFELKADGTGLRQVTPGEYSDVDNYDACYLPDGRIIFDSTRCFQGIPCVGGADQVANLFIMDQAGKVQRQLCFDQDHDWCPTLLNNGRVMYTRWEYSDTPHYFSRLLFHMNPDGTGQMEFYGSNSFWPNSLFYTRPLPGHPSQVVSVVSGHHGVRRMGELVILDPARGRFEADGVVQGIPGFGKKVQPLIKDQLVNDSWPRFVHPWPLDDHFFLVSCQPAPGRLWGLYLVDRFDNLLCLKELPGHALFEPISLTRRSRPPVIPDRVQPEMTDATIYLYDVYRGPGLQGVPKGAVKRLRLYEFHYAYNKMGGHAHVGIEGPWDVRRILGTVPVEEDGSAAFVVPANTPIAIQPLDGEGKALQVMRSWFTAMPGETLSCVGCHESQNTVPPVGASLAARRAPDQITPWRGPARGFSFKREVQPVLNRNCLQCHVQTHRLDFSPKKKPGWRNFTPAYLALHPYVNRPGPESDYHLQRPLEFHADTSELVQMLQKGHQGVELTPGEWDRLITWIDLNVPDHGTWGEHAKVPGNMVQRRLEMRTRYAGRPEDPEEILFPENYDQTPVPERPKLQPRTDKLALPGWPWAPGDLAKSLAGVDLPGELALDLGDGVKVDFVLIPAGRFIMGSNTGGADEAPRAIVNIDQPFYLSRCEITRAQFNRFDPTHDNGYINQRHKDHTTPGYGVNRPGHPVIRVTWQQARDFAAWLGKKSGNRVDLPTEAEWEWACRAGRETPFSFGDGAVDFSPYANLADASIKLLAVTGVNPKPIPKPNRYQDYLPADRRFNDGQRIMALAGAYKANGFGLKDMHGNVWEWTRSDYRAYPYVAADGRNQGRARGVKVVRGGSWRDRPRRSTASFRLGYRYYQPVFNVGIRLALYPVIGKVNEK